MKTLAKLSIALALLVVGIVIGALVNAQDYGNYITPSNIEGSERLFDEYMFIAMEKRNFCLVELGTDHNVPCQILLRNRYDDFISFYDKRIGKKH